MAKTAKELSQIKARQTKLGKKSYDELVQIILKKDNIERNLNNQIKGLKGEVNVLSARVNAFDKDMEGTMQTIEVYKDKIKTLNEKNDSLTIRNKDINCLYETEREKVTAVINAAKMWKHITFVTSAITITIVLINILSAIM